MAQILMTIEEYIAEIRKKDTIFIGFNPRYAKAWMRLPDEEDNDDDTFGWLSKENVNWNKRDEFLAFMAEKLPHIRLTDVFDFVPSSYLTWPFCGTIAIDVERGSHEEDLLNSRYEDENGEPLSLDAVIFLMTYDQAVTAWNKRNELEELEYD